eukprot:4610225-Pyramimonas_sp.AAC.2
MAWIPSSILPLFYFSTQKKVLIRDWKLGAALRSLQALILVYCFLRFFVFLEYLSPQIPTNFMHINSFSGKEYLRAQQAAWDVSEDVWNNSKCGPAGARQYDHRHSEGGFSLHCSHQARWIECGACSASALVF